MLDRYRTLPLLTVGFIALASVACATSQDIVANPAAAGKQYRSAYLVAHGGRSSDVDAAIQRELFRRGIAVSTGPEVQHPENVDLVIRYADDWSWDMAMYLKSLDIQVYDATTSLMVASARWKNSPMHGFHGLDGVVSELVSGVLTKIGVKATAV